MKVIFNSIVVDPFVFYAVIVGILLSMGIIIFLLMKSKIKKEDYITLEPIVIQKNDTFETNSNILDINKKEEINEQTVEEQKPHLDNIITKMEETLNEEVIEPKKEYEQIEEEEAIISYQELLKLKIAEPVKSSGEPEIIEVEESNISPKTQEAIKIFKNSEFISPVFGKVDNNVEYPTIKEVPMFEEFDKEFVKTVDTKPLKKEFDKSEDFLNSLKDFRRSLE